MSYVFNWVVTGEGRNHILRDQNDCMIAIVYRKDAHKEKKMNNETRKYEYKDVPERWIPEIRIDGIHCHPFKDSAEDGKVLCEKLISNFLDATNDLREWLSV